MDSDEAELARLLPYAWVFTNADGEIQRANQSAVALFGGTTAGLAAHHIAMLVAPDERAQLRRTIASMAGTRSPKRWTTTLRGVSGAFAAKVTAAVSRHASGDVRGLRWLIEPVDPSGGGASWLLAETSAIVGPAFDPELGLRSLLDAALPTLGDWGMLDLLSQHEAIRRAAVACVATEDADLVPVVRHRIPCLGDSSDPIARVLNGGATEFLPDLQEHERSSLMDTTWGRDLVRRLSPRSWITVPLRARGTTIGALTFLTAGSRRRLLSSHVALAETLAHRASLAADNARLIEEATRAGAARSSFLAVMSHELRTPLTAIVGYTELLADGLFGPVSSEQLLQLSRVRESSEHLLHIVEDVLDYARIDAGQARPLIEDIDVARIAGQAAELVAPVAAAKEIELQLELPASPLRFRSDPVRVRQILAHLLGNAVKFTEQGRIRFAAYPRDGTIVFEVQDSGIGIPEHLLSQIFEPFWQVDQQLARRGAGTGLGLSIARELARLLGGGIDARSAPGRGSTFTVWLPIGAARTGS